MVFSSVPLYLDPPNWQQQVQNPNEIQNPQLPVGGSGGGAPPESNKPSSMGERTRLAKVQAAEGPLRCPRPGCESTNTKFCYFNNYNLSQPRHFCKACRRYWTRGGALRNVPVGGACRRKKRCKSGGARSKSPAAAAEGHKAASAAQPQQHHPPADHRLFHPVGPVSAPPYSFMASLQSLTSLGMGNLGQLGYGAAAAQPTQQQLSLFTRFGAAPSSSASGYPFQLNEGGLQETASFRKEMMGARAGAGQLSLSRPLLGGGVTENEDQFWSAHINNAAAGAGSGDLWTDLSGMN